ncbi:unnamed protein product [Danaus chrysippus]|uniref:(African queen) hypothetical protein n=1 Tax=Danaus chrysippus TaxID=151541 RepID=A0A8J2QDC3_9NEOP|nr:unnamed protein product [Danaus chrysippus]
MRAYMKANVKVRYLFPSIEYWDHRGAPVASITSRAPAASAPAAPPRSCRITTHARARRDLLQSYINGSDASSPLYHRYPADRGDTRSNGGHRL